MIMTRFFLRLRSCFRRQGAVALTIQAVGGGLASGSQPELGSHIALGGLCLQLGSVSYHLCCSGLH